MQPAQDHMFPNQNLKHLVESMPLRKELVQPVTWALPSISMYSMVWTYERVINIKYSNTLTNITIRQ